MVLTLTFPVKLFLQNKEILLVVNFLLFAKLCL